MAVEPESNHRRVMYDPVANKYFRVGTREAGFYEQLDGQRSIETLKQSNHYSFASEQVETLISWFEKNQLLFPGHEVGAEKKHEKRIVEFVGHYLNPDNWRFQLGSPDGFLGKHQDAVDSLFRRPALAIYLVVFFFPMLWAIYQPAIIANAWTVYHPILSVHDWVILYLMLLVTNVLHEFGHALACKHHGGRVGNIGIKFLYLIPVMYCDVSDTWRCRLNRDRVIVSFAGVFVQAILGSISLVAWLASHQSVFLVYVCINIASAALNLFPFVKFDGYWMLAHVLDEPSLQKRGVDEVSALICSIFDGESITKKKPLQKHLLIFGLSNLAVTPLFWFLGALGIYHYGSLVSPLGGIIAGVVAGGIAAYRIFKPASLHIASMLKEIKNMRAKS